MKRICKSLALILLALCLLPGKAQASGTASMAAGFRQDDQFYAFAALDRWPSNLSAELRSGRLSLPVNLGPEPLADSGLPVSYLLLVDCSAPMAGLRRSLGGFARALAGQDRTGARFAIAAFGEEFSLIWEGEKARFPWAASGLECGAEKADLSQGVRNALEYLSGRSRSAGELVNLVVVTAGVPDGDSAALAEAARQLEEEPSILVHTLVLHAGPAEAADTLDALGRGMHLAAGEGGAKAKGAELAEFVNGLCAMRFTWNAQDSGGVELYLSWEDAGDQGLAVDMENMPVLAVAQGGEGSSAPAGPSPPAVPSPSAGLESPAALEPAGPPEAPASPDGPTAPAGTGVPAGPEAPPPVTGLGAPGGQAIWAVGGAACAALLAAGVLLLRRKGGHSGAKAPKGAIFMRLEVISGTYAGPGELYLVDELVIGRGSRCDIPWRDKEVSLRNSRIFLRGNMLYIEDLGSRQGTALGGMRLHCPNRLRSGDEISIGTVRFRLKF